MMQAMSRRRFPRFLCGQALEPSVVKAQLHIFALKPEIVSRLTLQY